MGGKPLDTDTGNNFFELDTQSQGNRSKNK